MIPKHFNSDGLLNPGTYEATFSEIKNSILVHGDNPGKSWNKKWRLKLTESSEILVNQLWSVGVKEIFFDGSFVEDTDHPNDIDGYFDPGLSMESTKDMNLFEDIVLRLNKIDPHKVWDWDPLSRRPFPGFMKQQLPMWHFYRVELYPHLGQSSGIKDEYGNEQEFPAAFRKKRKTFKEKGIIKIIPDQGEKP